MKFKEIKKSSIYVTPHFPTKEMKRYKFSMLELIGYLTAYSLILVLLVILLFSFTPLRKTLYWVDNPKIEQQHLKIVNLEKQVVLLSKQIQKVSKLDERLKYAIILAASDSIDSSSAIYDSLRHESEKNKLGGGSMFYVVESLIKKFSKPEDSENQKKAGFYLANPVKKVLIVKKYEPNREHFGIDFAVKENTQVFSPAAGYVVFSGFTAIDGNVIIIEHQNNFRTILKHCNVLLKKQGDKVFQGELIALSGNSGINTSGPHLHLELWQSDKILNPEKYLIK
jgi:murein DD-endopeptidase MepM/ murein hydrolase activator NlpD